jgi:hypothetical protein
VADSLATDYLHSTRRATPGPPAVAAFEEHHSHATAHLLRPEPADRLTAGEGAVVLVDDELSTGRTAMNTIAALHALRPRERYVIAALVDVRSAADRDGLAARAQTLGVRVDVVSLASGELRLPPDVLERGARLVAEQATPHPAHSSRRAAQMTDGGPPGWASEWAWPAGVREGGRHGFAPAERAALEAAATDCARFLIGQLSTSPAGSVLVLATEELMYAPLRIATELARLQPPSAMVRYSSTSRSPVLAIDDPRYPVRTQLTFPATDYPADGPGPRFAYNVAAGADPARRFDDVVLVTDAPVPPELAAQLAAAADRVHRVAVPVPTSLGVPEFPAPLTGPDFGSYAADEVSWLLTDLSAVELEAPVEEREEAIQSGGAHYAESLPIEFQPSPQYQTLFSQALERSASRVAQAVGVVTELVLAERGTNVVLASLARAGTPVGVLMRRWAQRERGLELPHYAVSIVRGRGIDRVALAYLAVRHSAPDVVFVDGWTGKGAITAELAAAVAQANADLGLVAGHGFSTELAVLADTGHCVRTFGTRDDFLIPSACLNSTVSGLVSRTVLNEQHVGPGQFHGAKFYRHLAGADVSVAFLDAITAQFEGVRSEVAHQLGARERGEVDTAPSWLGEAAVRELGLKYGISDVNLIKPGVGETTRVLLRRVPWKVLMRRRDAGDLAHLSLLAEQRGVAVELVDELAYSCVGLIHPQFTLGATGADGVSTSAARP